MSLKRSFLAIFTGIFFWLSLPSLGMENSLGTKALAIASNHKGKLALAMSLLASYKLYKKHQKELKPIVEKILLHKDEVFWSGFMLSPLALSTVLQLYTCYKYFKNGIGITDKILGTYLHFIGTLPLHIFSLFIMILNGKFVEYLSLMSHQAIADNNYAQVKFLSYILGTNSHYWNYQYLPIAQAARYNRINALKALLSRYDCVLNDTVINIKEIIKNGYTEVLDLLIKNDLQFDPNMRFSIGNSSEPAIFYAYHFYQPKMVKLLIDLGADTSATDSAGNTIYDCAKMMPEMYHDILQERKAKIAHEVDHGADLIPDLAKMVAEYAV